MITDNNTIEGIINVTSTQKSTKVIEMRFFYILDRAQEG